MHLRHMFDFVVHFDLSEVHTMPTEAVFSLFVEVGCTSNSAISILYEEWSEEDVSWSSIGHRCGASTTSHVLGPFGKRRKRASGLDLMSLTQYERWLVFIHVLLSSFRVSTSATDSACQYYSRQGGLCPSSCCRFSRTFAFR